MPGRMSGGGDHGGDRWWLCIASVVRSSFLTFIRWWSSGGQFGLKLAGGDTAGGFSGGCWLVFGVPDVSSATHCAIMGEMVAALASLSAVRAASVPYKGLFVGANCSKGVSYDRPT